jgi:hypothetical protein
MLTSSPPDRRAAARRLASEAVPSVAFCDGQAGQDKLSFGSRSPQLQRNRC